MLGAIQGVFINAEDKSYDFPTGPITSHYVTIIDEDARGMAGRYTQLKAREEDWKRLGLSVLAKVQSLIGKNCQFSGRWTQQARTVKIGDASTSIMSWVFHIQDIKVLEADKKVA